MNNNFRFYAGRFIMIVSLIAVGFSFARFTAPAVTPAEDVAQIQTQAITDAVVSGELFTKEQVDAAVADAVVQNNVCTANSGKEEGEQVALDLSKGLIASGEDINPDWKILNLHPNTTNAGWQVIAPTAELRRIGISSDPGQIEILDASGASVFAWDSNGRGYTARVELPAGWTLRFRTGWNDANENWNSWVEQYKLDSDGDLSWRGDAKSLHEREDKPWSWTWDLLRWDVISQ